MFTPEGRVFVILTADRLRRQVRLEGDKIITQVDVASNQAWKGTDQVLLYRIEGNNLYIQTAPFSALTFGGSMVRGILVWERAN